MAICHLWNHLPSVIIFQIFASLSPHDRLIASSACKSWRECIYHTTLWPSPRMTINVSKKRTVKWKLKLRRHYITNDTTDRDNTMTLKMFIGKCSRFLTHISFAFDSDSSSSINHMIDIIQILVSYDHSDDHNNNTLTDRKCHRLRSISLRPTTSLTNAHSHHFNTLQRLLSSLELLIRNTPTLEHISLGCLQQLLNHSPSLLSLLSQEHSNQMKCLHLATIKENPDYYPVVELPWRLFAPFANVKVLSIDYDNIGDELLRNLAVNGTIDKLIINVHGIDDDHMGVSKSSWTQLARSNDKLEVTMNLLHTDDSFGVLRESMFDTDMPLTHFRAYYVAMADGYGEGICDTINFIAAKHCATLKSTILVHNLKQFTSMPNIAFARTHVNPLLMLAWRCKQLEHLTVIGFEVCDADLIAITRLRGSALKELNFPSCCISLLHSPIAEDEGYYDDDKFYLDGAALSIQRKVIEDIAKPLNREWVPMQFTDLPKSVINRYDRSDTTYLSTLLSDESW